MQPVRGGEAAAQRRVAELFLTTQVFTERYFDWIDGWVLVVKSLLVTH
jgi:hypothetical protein